MSELDKWIAENREPALVTDENGDQYDTMTVDCEILSELISIAQSQPTIRDYIKANESDWKKCHRKMVNISSLYEFIGESEE